MNAIALESTPVRSLATNARTWAGRVLTAIPVLFLTFDAGIKLAKIPVVVESFERLGWSPDISRTIGLLQLACLIVHLVPRTAVVGAILVTGFLGGAIATHLRLGDPLFSHTLFPAYVAALIWGGLYLRDPRVKTLITKFG
jgi:hypothetical protein